MPQIFQKDCKIKVIEYGAHTPSQFSWDAVKNAINDLVHRLTSKKAA